MKAWKLGYLSLVMLLALTWWLAGCAKVTTGGGGGGATLTASPASFDFGTVTVGSSKTQTITLNASGSVSVQSSSLSGSSTFSVSGLTPPLTVGSSTPATFSVTFAPTAAGAVNATLTVTSDASNAPTTITLTGTGSVPATPTLSVSPAAVGFGSVTVGTTNFQPATMTALNGAVTVNSVSISDPQVTLSGISFPLALAANQSAPYTVVYHPTTASNNYNATITFSTTGVPNTTTQTVSAIALPPPQVSLVAPTGMNFGNVSLGSSQTVNGSLQAMNGPVSLQSIGVTNSYSYSGIALPLTIQPNFPVNFSVTFTPQVVGSQPGTITFQSNASNSPTNISLTGSGVNQPTLTVIPATMDFGNVAVGQSVSQPGGLSAAGGDVIISSTNASDPQIVVSGLVYPQTVPNNQSVPFTVTYTPTAAGTFNATITFNITTSPFTVTENVTASPFNPAPHQVTLNWTDTDLTVRFNVYRGVQAGGPYTKRNITLVSGTSFIDPNVVSGTTYFYVVTAVSSLGVESSFSNEVKAVIPIP